MTEDAEFVIGADVACSDGICGDLRRVVIDPVPNAITHLVVGRGQGHLVPIDLVTSTTAREIRLACTKSDFEALEAAEEMQLIEGLGGGQFFVGGSLGSGGQAGVGLHEMPVDRVPVGEVVVRHGDDVHATDGHIGRVKGLVVDPSARHVTHVLLDEGHLWGEKTVAIPIGAVTAIDDGVRVSLSKDEIKALPPIDIDRPV